MNCFELGEAQKLTMNQQHGTRNVEGFSDMNGKMMLGNREAVVKCNSRTIIGYILILTLRNSKSWERASLCSLQTLLIICLDAFKNSASRIFGTMSTSQLTSTASFFFLLWFYQIKSLLCFLLRV